MRKLIFLAALALMAAPAAALAGSPAETNAAKSCAAERTGMGATAFNSLYGGKANAFGKCVAKRTAAEAANLANAARACKAEAADANFTALHSDQTFAQTYGSNDNDKNAMGKCVSLKAKAASQAQVAAAIRAAKACKAERAASATTFAGTYGTGANALGKCIAAKSKA